MLTVGHKRLQAEIEESSEEEAEESPEIVNKNLLNASLKADGSLDLNNSFTAREKRRQNTLSKVSNVLLRKIVIIPLSFFFSMKSFLCLAIFIYIQFLEITLLLSKILDLARFYHMWNLVPYVRLWVGLFIYFLQEEIFLVQPCKECDTKIFINFIGLSSIIWHL